MAARDADSIFQRYSLVSEIGACDGRCDALNPEDELTITDVFHTHRRLPDAGNAIPTGCLSPAQSGFARGLIRRLDKQF